MAGDGFYCGHEFASPCVRLFLLFCGNVHFSDPIVGKTGSNFATNSPIFTRTLLLFLGVFISWILRLFVDFRIHDFCIVYEFLPENLRVEQKKFT